MKKILIPALMFSVSVAFAQNSEQQTLRTAPTTGTVAPAVTPKQVKQVNTERVRPTMQPASNAVTTPAGTTKTMQTREVSTDLQPANTPARQVKQVQPQQTTPAKPNSIER